MAANHSFLSDVAEFESLMALDNPIKSSTATRWERRARQQVHAGAGGAEPCPVDRYIPNRSGMEHEISHMSSFLDEENTDRSEVTSEHSKLLTNTLDKPSEGARVLAFKNKAPAPADGFQSSLRVLYSSAGAKKEIVKPTRQISSSPFKVLDAPDMLDDYYLNLLSWGGNNTLAVALSQTAYLWNAASGEIKQLMTLGAESSDYVSSLAWIQHGGSHIAVGTSLNTVQLWDVQAGRQVRNLTGHAARVSALAWNSHVLTSGSKDNTILHHDVRVQQHVVGRMAHHTQEVCGLAWSPDGQQLASGANDNLLCLSDMSQLSMNIAPRHVLAEHQAAVKALAWSPHEHHLLASGGGTADRCIKFWNSATGALINSIDTCSQVCALQWSPFEKELLSSHGYAENQLCLWSYPSMARMKEFKAHTSRVLHMAVSPDGSMVCSGAADETLRFWNIFAGNERRKVEHGGVAGVNKLKAVGPGMRIR